MKNEKKTNIGVTDLILLALSALFLVGIRTFFSACGPMEDGGWMTCHWTGQAVTGVAALLLVLAVIHLFAPKGGVKLGVDLAVIPTALLAICIPGHLIGLCMMPEMQCRAVMTPCTTVLSVLIAAAAAADLLLQRKRG